MITLDLSDLSKTPLSHWDEALTGALNAVAAEKATVESIQRDGQLRALRSREHELLREWQRVMFDLNDVRERMALLQDASYERSPL